MSNETPIEQHTRLCTAIIKATQDYKEVYGVGDLVHFLAGSISLAISSLPLYRRISMIRHAFMGMSDVFADIDPSYKPPPSKKHKR